MPLVRITVTIPADLVEAADARAAAAARSRSWIVSEALRRQLADAGPAADGPTGRGLGPYRLAQLEADLRLTPAQRAKEAERTGRAVGRSRGGGNRQRVLTFDRYEDYLAWKRRDDISP